jgi:hypothetical protein
MLGIVELRTVGTKVVLLIVLCSTALCKGCVWLRNWASVVRTVTALGRLLTFVALCLFACLRYGGSAVKRDVT